MPREALGQATDTARLARQRTESGVVRPQPCLPPTRRRTAVAGRSDPWDDG
jgi:hypothetical protein